MTTPSHTTMRFDKPAVEWTSALPLGNGRLGLMVFGGIEREHLQVNDGTAWSGSDKSQSLEPRIDAAAAKVALQAAREDIAAERFDDAAAELKKFQHRHSQAFLPFADLHLTTSSSGANSVTNYSRTLDLTSAIHEVRYELDGFRVLRQTFVSAPDGVAVVTVSTENPAGLDLSLETSTELRVVESRADNDSAQLLMKFPSDIAPAVDRNSEPVSYSDDDSMSMQGAFVVQWSHDGSDTAASGMSATGVTKATIILATETTFTAIAAPPKGDAYTAFAAAQARASAALADGADAIRARQRADHEQLFSRSELITDDGQWDDVSLDERLRRGNADPAGVLGLDPGLAGLLYNFGRYLLISSSREGGIPANLQGIWNDQIVPPWSSNYTTNINVEMNYWPAEVTNLPECVTPLFDLIDGLAKEGTETASRLYDAPGWVAHHNADPWGYTQPVGFGKHDPRWAFWPMAGPWLIRHLWEHVLFGADDEFARTRAWPPIRSAAEFYLHWLIELPDGSIGTSPSTSPENIFAAPDGSGAPADQSSTLDLVLISDLFRILDGLADRLGRTDDDVVRAAAAVRARIPAPTIGRGGMIPEWRADRPQLGPLHRHVSHLYFAFPGDTPLTHELAAGVSASLDGRGDEATGWSLAWKVALRARLGQANKVSDLLALVFRDMEVDRGAWIGGLYPNLFDAHPPFQIDGNFGFAAGIVECLVHSHTGEILLMPAVPRELAKGSVRGVIARPGVEISIQWAPDAAGAPAFVSATLLAVKPGAVGRHAVRLGDSTISVELAAGTAVTIVADDFQVRTEGATQ